nr:recombinase [uncultured Flavobacterium sp.]
MSFQELFYKYFLDDQYISEDDLGYLVDLVNIIRPKKHTIDVNFKINELIYYLKTNPAEAEIVKNYLISLFQDRKFFHFLSDAGILRDSYFLVEVKKRLFARILPEQPGINSIEYVLAQVFYKHDDYKWLLKITDNLFLELINIFQFPTVYKQVSNFSIIGQITTSLSLLTQRITGRVMERDVIKMVPEYDHFGSIFQQFEFELTTIINKVRTYKPHYIHTSDEGYKKTLILLTQCDQFVDLAFSNSSKYGISMKVNQSLLRIRQQLQRIRILLNFLLVDKEEDQKINAIKIWRLIINLHSIKNNVGQLINESTQLISYEITKHSAKSGEKYITETSSEYYKMLKASLGGGMIVGVLCIIKLLFSKVETSAFGHAFLYSLNYAAGFITIFLLHFTLATKQPAMTAATLSKALEEAQNSKIRITEKYESFAKLFARLFRTQFIAFVGNVVLAFPVSLLLVWLFDLIFKYNIAESKATKLLIDLDPIDSPAILHASIAGIFLFISGIISGNISNKYKHEKIFYRIEENPFLKNNFGKKNAKRLASWFERNWAGFVSNGWFGVFLGSTASIGIFLGLNLDIRHITFASGNFALGLYGKSFTLGWEVYLWSIIGITLIGFFNFIVSFSLSLMLAMRSRNIPFKEFRFLHRAIIKRFKAYPLTFFFPPKEAKNEFLIDENQNK